MKTIDLRTIAFADRMPARHRPESSGQFPRDMIGATIDRIGAPADPSLIEGSGLVIDYRPQGSAETKRAVFGFNELGMWLEVIAVLS